MFHTLRKIVIALFWLGLVAVAGLLYTNRHVFRPVGVWVDLIQNKEWGEEGYIGSLSGRVITVSEGNSFKVRNAEGTIYSLGLAGLEIPNAGNAPNPQEKKFARRSAEYLSGLILSNRVEIELTFTNRLRTGLGMVRHGSTNVNLAMVKAGWARVKPEYIRALPLIEQYHLTRAQQKAQQNQAGFWNP